MMAKFIRNLFYVQNLEKKESDEDKNARVSLMLSLTDLDQSETSELD